MEIDHPILGKYQIIKPIGHGSFASVYLAKHIVLDYLVAIKIIKKADENDNDKNSFDLFNSIIHPFVCQDFDFIKTIQGDVCIIMEYVEGPTLLEYVNEHAPLSEDEIKTIFGQLVITIDFLHKHHIIHRDLKCENIIIDKFKNIRLIDLNFSCNNIIKHSTICGSPSYMAPELINKQQYGNSVDIWSIGIILYAITYGTLPFENSNMPYLFDLITNSEPILPKFDGISDNLIDLIEKLLIKDPNQRISLNGIKNHPFFTSDNNGNEFIFTEQQINLFVHEPQSQVLPEIQILKQMDLSVSDSFDAINEIKARKNSYYSMTYNILYKNYISAIQLPYYCSFLLLVNMNKKAPNINIHLKINLKKAKNDKISIQTERIDSKSRFRLNNDEKEPSMPLSPSTSREKIKFNNVTNKAGLPSFIKGRVQFRRFSSIGNPFSNVGTKKCILNQKILSSQKAGEKVVGKAHYASADILPQLKKC